MVWVTVIFRWLYFYLINRRHPSRWVAVVSWLKHLILAVDLWGSSAQHQVKLTVDRTFALLHIHHAASNDFWSFMCRLKIEQILEATSHERTVVQPLISYLENHPNKMDKACGTLLEKQGELTRNVLPWTPTHGQWKCWPTWKDISTTAR